MCSDAEVAEVQLDRSLDRPSYAPASDLKHCISIIAENHLACDVSRSNRRLIPVKSVQ